MASLGVFLVIFSCIGAGILITKFFLEGSSFKQKIRNMNINEKSKIEDIENELKKDNSPVIITKDYLIVFNNDTISLEEIRDINLKIYTKKSSMKEYMEDRVVKSDFISTMIGFLVYKIFTLPHKRIAVEVKFKGKRNRGLTIDICRARYMDEFEKKEIENKIIKLKETINLS